MPGQRLPLVVQVLCKRQELQRRSLDIGFKTAFAATILAMQRGPRLKLRDGSIQFPQYGSDSGGLLPHLHAAKIRVQRSGPKWRSVEMLAEAVPSLNQPNKYGHTSFKQVPYEIRKKTHTLGH